MIKAKILLILLIICQLSVFSQLDKLPSGNIEGYLQPSEFSNRIKMVFRLHAKNDSLYAKFYVPSQSVFAERSSSVEIKNDSIFMHFDRLDLEYKGKIDIKNKIIHGNYIQRINVFPLNLYFIPDEDASSFNRPQSPQEPANYIIQEHKIESDDIVISGSLHLPDSINNHKLAIIVTGGGTPIRNFQHGGHETFKVLADYLANNGIACFLYDERGAGESTGNFRNSTTRDFTRDAISIFNYFKNHNNIDSTKIGFIGHSEGALIVAKTHRLSENKPAFNILLSCPAVPIIELMKQQSEYMYIEADIDDDNLRQTLTKYRQNMFDTAYKHTRVTAIRRNIVALTEELAESLNEEQIKRYGVNTQGAHSFIASLTSAWLRYFLKLKPANYISELNTPLLVLYAEHDHQVDAYSNYKAFKQAFNNDNADEFTIKIIKGVNHIYQPTNIPGQKNYMYVEETIDTKVLEKISNFLK